MRTVAIVVARAGSRRLPGKALRPFAGSTLVGLKCATLSACSSIDAVYIGSDSADILREGARVGAIPVLRDDYHCDESRCSANEMLRDMAEKVDGDTVVWAHPTNPLVKPATFERALREYRERGFPFDSLCSVHEGVRRHAWCRGRPINYDPRAPRHVLAFQCDPILWQNGAIFIQGRAAMMRNSYFFGDHPILFEMSVAESADIDTLADFEAAEAAYTRGGAR